MAFPAVSLIDSFIRAAEKPLSNGGIWALMGSCTAKGEVAAEAWKGTTAFPAEDGVFYSQEELSGEVGHAIEMHLALSNERYLKLWCCMAAPDLAAKTGYFLQVTGETTAGKVKFALKRWAESAPAVLGEKAAVALAVGDRIAISVQAGHVIAWKKAGAGAWEELLNVADATYTQGYVGITSAGNAHAWRNSEAGGTVTSTRILTTTGQKQTAKLAHSISRTLRPSQAQSAVLLASVTLVTTQGSSVQMVRSVAKVKTRTQGSTAKLSKRPVRTLSASQGSTAQVAGQPAMGLKQAVVVTLSHSLVKGKVVKQASAAKLTRALARTLVLSSSTSTSLGDRIEGARSLTVGQGQLATLSALVLTELERKIREEEEARREREREEREEREVTDREPHTTIGSIVLSGAVMS